MLSSLRALKRDLAAIATTLGASRPSPVVQTTRPVPARAHRRLRVASIVRETADAVTLVLEDPAGAPIRFSPGQFFTLVVPLEGEVIKRAYSASSSAADGQRVAVTIKRTPDGRVSKYLVEKARAGDSFEVLGPSGSFTPVPATHERLLVLVGGGSGITPLLSITRTLLATEPATRIALVYGNRAREDVIFWDALESLATTHGPRFRIRHVLEQPSAGWADPAGRLDGEALARELDALGEPDGPTTDYFLCGPEPMMRAARACLEGRGVAAARVHQESFAAAHASAASAPTSPQLVTVLIRGDQKQFVVAPPRTVLETALDAGIDMPFSCTVGGCGTCRVRLVEGHVAMEEPNCLTADERTQGYVLACVARPASPCTFEVP